MSTVRRAYCFSADVADGITLSQRPFRDVYDLRSARAGMLLVKDVNGWIVAPQLLFGSFDSTKYFAIELSNQRVQSFESMSGMNAFLRDRHLSPYDMSSEENVSHMKYGGGRDRKYPIKIKNN